MAIITRNIEERYQQNPVWLAWLVCLSASLLVAYEFFNQTVFGSLSVPLMKAFHLNAGQLGVLSSTYFYANALFLIPAGLLLDRYSTRAWILVAMLFCTVGTFGFALAPNAETAGVFRFIMRVLETAADLALLVSIISSLKNTVLPRHLLIFGEVGLGGEIRPVPNGQERLQEAAKHGFKKAIVPKANAPKQAIPGLEVIAVSRLDDALAAM